MIFSFGFGLSAQLKLTLKFGDQRRLKEFVLIVILRDNSKLDFIVFVYVFHFFLSFLIFFFQYNLFNLKKKSASCWYLFASCFFPSCYAWHVITCLCTLRLAMMTGKSCLIP